MSLVNECMVDCTMMDKTTKSDGRGGFTTTWVDGASFRAAIAFDSSNGSRIAEAMNEKSSYSVLTYRNITLQFHDVFRREEDGKIFRVTTDGDDNKTPMSAGLTLRKVNAEEFVPAEA